MSVNDDFGAFATSGTISRRRLIVLTLGLLLLLCTLHGPAQAGEQKAFELDLGNGDGDGHTVRVHHGDRVVLRLSAGEKMTLHFHGYDRIITLKPGRVETIEFDADIAGRFPINLHAGAGKSHDSQHNHGDHGKEKRDRLGKSLLGSSHHRALVYVEVHPR